MQYNVTVTRTGGITVDADSSEEAFAVVNEMSKSEIEEHAQLSGWEASDVELLEYELFEE